MYVYTVTPESVGNDEDAGENFRTRISQAAEASEQAGWTGMLVPHNLHEVDPWMVACYLGSVTESVIPLLALQPASTPPHAAAAAAAAYALLFDRPMYFNLVAGARDDEMRRIGDDLTHDQRYERLRQYGSILRRLLQGESVTESSGYYVYNRFRLEPWHEALSQCKFFMAGSSDASMSVAADIADVIVTHPVPYADWRESFLEPLRLTGYDREIGIRIGIICRPDAGDAWQAALGRFPESWVGRQETALKQISQNVWSRNLALRAMTENPEFADTAAERDPYWLGAFRSGRASAPFLVGSYAQVSAKLGEYTDAGVSQLLLSGSHSDDFEHIVKVINKLR